MAFSARAVVAFDQAAVCGAVLGRGSGGVRSLARVPLPGSALRAHPFDHNIADAGAVREALQRIAHDLRLDDGVCLVLPDGVGMLSLLEVPAGLAPADYARHRLRAALPYPAEEAVVDVLRFGERRALAAAVRRRVVEGYEEAVAGVGIRQDRIDLAPLAALGALSREAAPEGTVDLVLGDAALSLAVPGRGSLLAFRNRRRDPGPDEGRRLREEAERTALLAGVAPARLRVVGSGAPSAIAALRAAGARAEPGWSGVRGGVDGSELAWLAAAV